MFDEYFSNLIDDDAEFMPLMPVEEIDEKDQAKLKSSLPILPLRNTVLFPGVVIPITIGRDKSLKALKAALKADKHIGVLSQKEVDVEDPEPDDLNKIGTVARILKNLKMPDGSTTVIIQGRKRFEVQSITHDEPYILAEVSYLSDDEIDDKKQLKALMGSMKDLAEQIIRLSPNIPSESSVVLKNIKSLPFLTHFIASNLSLEMKEKQKVLAVNGIIERAETVLSRMNSELQILELKNQIHSKVKTDIEKQQRDYFLNQQMKTIQEELGGTPVDDELQRLRKLSAKKKWDTSVQEFFDKELNRLSRVNPAAAEYSVQVNHLELMLDLPWNDFTKDHFDLDHARKILDQDHHGLEKVKDRIIEYLAVLQLKGDLKSPILCFVGPPGVGKTSLGKSIARALKRKYVRMSLGGMRDESEIRGHRKTYIGAMPGRILQSLKKSKSSNPVFVLDEIDKVGSDFRGDPSSALLEVLDPEQNTNFYDNYLELDYNLSHTMFIATANDLNTIQPALRDRLEIIYISGYSVEEKVQIAQKHLIPKQRKEHGLKAQDIKLTPKVIEKIIQDYTRESGVRDLERKIAGVMRGIAKRVATKEKYNKTIQATEVTDYLGIQKFDFDLYKEQHPSGVAVGLAWTSVGGEILFIETSVSKGKQNLTLTGNLGNVMKESATTALSYLKRHATRLGLDAKLFEKTSIHIHVPAGAIPKDGPSAGITMMTSLASALTGKRVKPFLAMTGEITLRGKVLPVGGIKEKILAAKRAGMKEIIMCERNRKDVEEINPSYVEGLQFYFVNKMEEVLEIALTEKVLQAELPILN